MFPAILKLSSSDTKKFEDVKAFINCPCGKPLWKLTFHMKATGEYYTAKCLNCAAHLTAEGLRDAKARWEIGQYQTKILVNTDTNLDLDLQDDLIKTKETEDNEFIDYVMLRLSTAAKHALGLRKRIEKMDSTLDLTQYLLYHTLRTEQAITEIQTKLEWSK